MKMVLVVDDEAALLELYASAISDLGHGVLTAHDGVEALALIRSHHPDLVISDHMMPRLTGLELLHVVRGEPALANTPFILISAASPKPDPQATMQLSKPISLEDLERVVTQALAESSRKEREPDGMNAAPEQLPSRGLNELLAWVTHEIKTPLGTARLNLQLMQRQLGPGGDPTLLRRCEGTLAQLDRIGSLVASVLDATMLSEGRVQLHPERQDLKQLVQEVVSGWRQMRPQAGIILSLPEHSVELAIDAERVRTVLDNLISNAVKYGGDQETVVALEPTPGRALIRVSDRGPGIDAAELPRLFDRFHRAEGSQGEGHGLGLYIAAASARLHGGSLRVRSERGQGTTFTLALPTTL